MINIGSVKIGEKIESLGDVLVVKEKHMDYIVCEDDDGLEWTIRGQHLVDCRIINE